MDIIVELLTKKEITYLKITKGSKHAWNLEEWCLKLLLKWFYTCTVTLRFYILYQTDLRKQIS